MVCWRTSDRLYLSDLPYSRGIMTPPGRIRLMKPLILLTQIALNFSNPQQTTMQTLMNDLSQWIHLFLISQQCSQCSVFCMCIVWGSLLSTYRNWPHFLSQLFISISVFSKLWVLLNSSFEWLTRTVSLQYECFVRLCLCKRGFFFFYVYSKYVIIKAVIPIWNSLHNILTKLFCWKTNVLW